VVAPNKNAWPLSPARHRCGLFASGPAYLLLLLPLDFFSPPELLRLLLLLPLLAWLRSLWVSLLPLLDMLPLLPLLFDEEDFELRDAIDISLDRFLRPYGCTGHALTLGAPRDVSVGCVCRSL
jgi:hypothetical protein